MITTKDEIQKCTDHLDSAALILSHVAMSGDVDAKTEWLLRHVIGQIAVISIDVGHISTLVK